MVQSLNDYIKQSQKKSFSFSKVISLHHCRVENVTIDSDSYNVERFMQLYNCRVLGSKHSQYLHLAGPSSASKHLKNSTVRAFLRML